MTRFPEILADALHEALEAAIDAGELAIDSPPDVELERPRDRTHGDWATNLALALAGAAALPPRQIAEILVRRLPAVPHVAAVEIAGPGFVNFRLEASWLYDVLRRAAHDPGFARSNMGGGRRVQVEFVSVNPNGPLHIGHGRTAVFGDALANLLEHTGHRVEREYYVNDAGRQMDLYASSLEARYLEALGREAAPPEEGYHGEYLAAWAGDLVEEVGDAWLGLSADERHMRLRDWGIERALSDIRDVSGMAGIQFDSWFRESELYTDGRVAETLDDLRRRGAVYEAADAAWLRSSEFGDEKDRVVVRSDGTYTYLAPDIAYHRDKFDRGFDRLIDIWGADHHGYVPRMKAAVAALGHDPDQLELIITQLVNVQRAGQPVRMSTRAGEFITFRQVLEEVGPDATRFHLLAYSPDSAMTFDLELAKRQSMDNPVYYLQYAHARMASLTKFAAEQAVARKPLEDADLSLLREPAELELLRQIDRVPEEVVAAAVRRAPHRLTAFGIELAGAFHRFYTDCRVVTDDAGLTQSRLWLVEAARHAIVALLEILGLSAPEEM